ncbi:tRNA-binding protein [Candidatus Microgenomates bacterium]|nr:tRNA-binding protein [Candidatus Microgenomates bacterium]
MDKINFADFQKVEILIGTVVEAEVPSWSHWVIKLIVDFGEEIGQRKIFTGMLGFYEADYFVGRQFPFVVNLEPKKIGPEGDFSEGMLMAASAKLETPIKIADEDSDEKPVLFTVSEKVPNGTKVR